MSAVMYCYSVPIKEWWGFVEGVRNYYLEHNSILRSILESDKHYSVLDELEDTIKVELQVFCMGEDYLFRVLEHGHFFLNNYKGFPVPPESVFYDDRTDVPKEDEPNKEVAKEVDELIDKRRYFLYPLIDRGLVSWERFKKRKEKTEHV